MKKYNLIRVCFLIFIVITLTIDLFCTITGFNETNKKLESISSQTRNLVTLVQENQLNTNKTISDLSLQINNKITELSKDAEEQSWILSIAINDVKSSSLMEIEAVKNLIISYTEEVKKKKAVENLIAVNALVESEVLMQQYLSEGSFEYENENFTEAINVYKKIIDIDPTNAEAICYFNASMYFQNPGDGSNFPGIKKDLIFFLEGNTLTYDEERTTLNVLIGIGMEEGDLPSLEIYRDALHQLEDNR